MGQIEDVLKEYEGRDKEDKTEPTERDYADVKRYLVDRHVLEILKKRLSRGFSRIPEFVLDFTAAGVTIIGGLASVISDIGGILSAPSGIGAGIAALAKTIAAVASGVLSGILKATKSGYQLVRKAVRKVKQYGRDKGWWGDKTKTTAAKQERYKRDIIRIMQSVADLKDYDPSDEASKAVYARAKLQLEATGVNLQELFAENGKPLEQAKLIYKAMVKRE